MNISREIAKEVPEDKFIKMQRYMIFVEKMEQLKLAEEKRERREEKTVFKMRSSFVNSQKPLKDLLFYYNKAAIKGFDSSLVCKTLEQINLAIKAGGNKRRPYEDYALKDLDQSWRMQMLANHLKTALSDEMYFNHHFMGRASR